METHNCSCDAPVIELPRLPVQAVNQILAVVGALLDDVVRVVDEEHVIAAAALHQGADQGQRRPHEHKQVGDLEHRSCLSLVRTKTFSLN